MHGFYLLVVALELPQNCLLVVSLLEAFLDEVEVLGDFGKLLSVGLLVLCLVQQQSGLIFQLIDFSFKLVHHWLEVVTGQLVDVDHVVVPVLADGAPEANSTRAVLAKAHDSLVTVLCATYLLLASRCTLFTSRFHLK